MRYRHGKRFKFGILSSRYLTAFILLLLAEEPTHGYDLVTKLSELGFPFHGVSNMGQVYRLLNSLELNGMLNSYWDTSSIPHRRVYSLTPLGFSYLREVLEDMIFLRDLSESFISRYNRLFRKQRGISDGDESDLSSDRDANF